MVLLKVLGKRVGGGGIDIDELISRLFLVLLLSFEYLSMNFERK